MNQYIKHILLATAMLTGASLSASITLVVLPSSGTDLASGISSSNTYTHAFDFGEGSSTSVNGVSFTAGFPDGSGGGVSEDDGSNPYIMTDGSTSNTLTIDRGGVGLAGIGDSLAGAYTSKLGRTTLADGDSFAFFNSFGLIGGDITVGETLTFTIGGLTFGSTYSARLYGEAWTDAADAREITVGANGEDLLVDWSDPNNSGSNAVGTGFYIDITYTATGAEQDIILTIEDTNQGPHMAGFTNQLTSAAVPEPSTYALILGLVSIVGIYTRRRLLSR